MSYVVSQAPMVPVGRFDDVVQGLAADFDGSLSSLGQDVNSGAFNMTEALSALPYPQTQAEGVGNLVEGQSGGAFAATNGESLVFATLTDVGVPERQLSTLPAVSSAHRLDLAHSQKHTVKRHQLPSTSSCSSLASNASELLQSGFQCVLCAPSSPCTKRSEESVTYLNQSQSYELRLSYNGGLPEVDDCEFVRTFVRVGFYERRLMCMEAEQLDIWQHSRAGERMLEVDVPNSYGMLKCVVDRTRTNVVEVLWKCRSNVGLFVKIHAIGTEFTPRKHGGEKGVPFRLTVVSWLDDAAGRPAFGKKASPGAHPSQHLPPSPPHHSSSTEDVDATHQQLPVSYATCQIKVFKPKGADRKNKTDWERFEKLTDQERDLCALPGKYTVLAEVPRSMLNAKSSLPSGSQTSNFSFDDDEYSGMAKIARTDWLLQQPGAQAAFPAMGKYETDGCMYNYSTPSDSPPHVHATASAGISGASGSPVGACPVTTVANYSAALSGSHTPSPTFYLPDGPPSGCAELSRHASADDVQLWLHAHRFDVFARAFANFTGHDLLRLSKDDLKDICGTSDGIRIFNALTTKRIQPKLTLYVTLLGAAAASPQMPFGAANDDCGPRVFHAVFLHSLTTHELRQSLMRLLQMGASQPELVEMYLIPSFTPPPVHIVVTDQLIQHLPDRAQYAVECYANDTSSLPINDNPSNAVYQTLCNGMTGSVQLDATGSIASSYEHHSMAPRTTVYQIILRPLGTVVE